MPDISVIIPIYNVEKYLEECMESLAMQSFEACEFICIDDGSMDDSYKIVEKYTNKDNRFQLIRQENKGPAETRNVGIRKARGKYLAFLDSDDFFTDSSVLAELYRKAEEWNLEILSFETKLLYKDSMEEIYNKDSYYVKSHVYNGIRSGRDFFIEMMSNHEYCDSVGFLLIKREWLLEQKIMFYPGILYEDALFCTRCYLRAERMAHIRKKFYTYRVRENSIMTSKVSWENVRSRVVVYREILRLSFLPENENPKLQNAIMEYLSLVAVQIKDLDEFRMDEPLNQAFEPLDTLIMRSLELGKERREVNKKVILNGLEKLVADSEGIVIYGAGKVGRLFFRFLEEKGLREKVLCFATSSRTSSPNACLNGIPVIPIREAIEKSGQIILSAVNKDAQRQMQETLRELKVNQFELFDRHIYYALQHFVQNIDAVTEQVKVHPASILNTKPCDQVYGKQHVKVSVIIYVKNTVNYVESCIRSVMNQTLREIEILIIDGGSTDGTLDIIEKLQKEDARIRFFHASGSVGAQFNLGLQKAKGQYIGVCEADDAILPDMYEKQYQIASENQLDVIRAGHYRVCNIYHTEYRFEQKACYQSEMTGRVIESNNDTFFLEQGINGFWSGLYRRQFLLDNQIWMNETSGAAYQDISFSFLTQMYAKRIWFMKEAFYCYRIDNPNSSVNSPHGIALHIKEYEELKRRLVMMKRWEQYKHIFFSWELNSYRWFLKKLPDDLREVNMEKVYRCLKEEIEKERYDEKSVMENVRDYAQTLFYGKPNFAQELLRGTEQKDALLTYITGTFREDRLIVLFGIGNLGKMMKQFLELSKKDVILTDNSNFLQKNGVMGKPVYQPKEVVKRFPDARYIIASAAHAPEMKEQLLKMGVQSKNVLIFDDDEFIVQKIFMKAVPYAEG